jgi:hypothetical protein
MSATTATPTRINAELDEPPVSDSDDVDVEAVPVAPGVTMAVPGRQPGASWVCGAPGRTSANVVKDVTFAPKLSAVPTGVVSSLVHVRPSNCSMVACFPVGGPSSTTVASAP